MCSTNLQAKIEVLRALPSPPTRRALRIEVGLTQQDVADVLKVRRETVSRWESGTRDPRGELLVAYVALLKELRTHV